MRKKIKVVKKEVKEVKEEKKEKHAGGRPSSYSFELAQEMCQVLGSTTKSIKILCEENAHWPNPDSFFVWLNKHKEFSDVYYKARRDQVEALVEQMIEICDDREREYVTLSDGKIVPNMIGYQKDKLKIETLKWRVAKMRSDIYGDRIPADTGISDEEAINKVRDLIHKCSQSK